MTIKEIAASLGVSKQTVTRTIKKLNIETKWVGNRAVIDSQDDIERITAAVQSLQSIQKNDSNAPKYESNVAKNAKSAPENEPNETNQQLINMLQKELENKEKMIQRQQDTIDNLIRTNTALTAKVTMLEDKSSQQQQNTIVVPEPETKETKQEGRKHWWQRLFN
jgi:transcriptional antiterminator